MSDADNLLKSAFAKRAAIYKSDTYPVGHSFTVEMQDAAFDWLKGLALND